MVAVKTIKSEYLTRDTADEYLKRFHREAQSAGGLNHPAIVRVFDLGDDYLVMELVEGRTLHRVIREGGRLAPEETLRLLAPVADAVDHAHRAGIVHRDIKPANIMVQPDGQPKLMDFGVAKIEASVMTTAGQILGSPSYMSPEQIAGENVTGRSDLYSLAVVAYEMLTGQPPFQGKTITQVIYRVMHEAPPPPRQWNAALPARYDDVFARALAKNPAARFRTAGELRRRARPQGAGVRALGAGRATARRRAAGGRLADDPGLAPPPPRQPRPAAPPRARARARRASSRSPPCRGSRCAARPRSRPRRRPADAIASPDAPPATPAPEAPTPAPSRAPARPPLPPPRPPAPPRRAPAPTPPLRRRPRRSSRASSSSWGPASRRPCASAGSPPSYPERARRMNLRGTVLSTWSWTRTACPTDLGWRSPPARSSTRPC